MNTTSPCFTLTYHTTGTTYDFRPRKGEVEVVHVVHIVGRRRDTYTFTYDEARRLWSQLRAKGYERF